MTIKLNAATGGGSVSLSAPNSTTSNLDVALTLPVDDGTSGQVLQTDGSGVLSWATASSDKITEGNTTAEVIDTGSDGRFVVTTEGTERARIDSSGRLLVGTSSAFDTWNMGTTYNSGLEGINQYGGLALKTNKNTVEGSYFALVKSRGTTANSKTIVNDGDQLGAITFEGADGTNIKPGAAIYGYVDGTPGTNDMPGRIVLSTTADGASSPTERMRIDSNGFVNIGAYTIPSSTPGMQLYGAGNLIFCKRSDTGEAISFFANSTTKVGNIVLGASSTTYNTSSDYRLKENVVPLAGATERLKQLPVHRFNFIVEPDKTVDGFLAHEAADVVPECVTGEKDAVDDDGNPIYQGIDQSKLVPLLTAALQETVQRIETLETANASLEARLTALEGGAS